MLKQYTCHKKVRAGKILCVDQAYRGGGATLHVQCGEPVRITRDIPFEFHQVTPAWMAKNSPQVGGYYVVYEDGYTSFSPADAFESGYSLKAAEPQQTFTRGAGCIPKEELKACVIEFDVTRWPVTADDLSGKTPPAFGRPRPPRFKFFDMQFEQEFTALVDRRRKPQRRSHFPNPLYLGPFRRKSARAGRRREDRK